MTKAAVEQSVLYQYLKKILVIRIGGIDEVLLATPLLRTIKENWPDKSLHVLVSDDSREVLENCPFIDDIRIFNTKEGLIGRFQYLNSLSSENYDLVIALTPTVTSYIGAKLTNAPHRLGIVMNDTAFDGPVAGYTLSQPFVFDLRGELAAGNKVPHEIELSFAIAEKMGLQLKSRDMFFKPSIKDKKFVVNKYKKWGWESGKKMFCIHLTDDWVNLGWTIKHFQRLVADLKKKHKDSYFVFTYESWRADIGREVDTAFEKDPSVHCIWDMTVHQFATFMKTCSYVIGFDFQVMHLASSQKIPVIALFKPEEYEIYSNWMGPWRVKNEKLLQKAPLSFINDMLKAIDKLDQMY